MSVHKVIRTVTVMFCLVVFAAQSWGSMQDQIDYDNTHPEWERIFHPGGPEYRGQWAFGIERFSLDKNTDEGFIAGYDENESLYLSGADNRRTHLWTSGNDDALLGGFSFSNDIASWLSPPEGMNRSILYTIREDYSFTGHPNNSDIVSINQDGGEIILKHGGLMGGTMPDTLGLEDPWGDLWGGRDVAISSLDYKADMAPIPQKFSHVNAINKNDYYFGIPQRIKNQSDEDIYFSSSKIGRFDNDHNLLYGRRINSTYGSQGGSGYSGNADGSAFYVMLDRYGWESGEDIGIGCRFDSGNGRWYGEVEIDDVTYKLYLEEADGSIKAYDPAKYPEDPANLFDPEAASGFPIRWHDDYELEATYGLDLGVDNYGQTGRWIAERSEYYYMDVRQAHAHAGDVMSETRTYEPEGNADGPMNPHERMYDGNGDMYVPDYYWNGVNAPTSNAGKRDSDSPYERAFHLIGVKGSWTEQTGTSGAAGTPPDGEHDWECMGETSPGSGTYNWRTFVGYAGVDQHPTYPDDDHNNRPDKTWTEWVYDAETETWSSHTAGPDMDNADGNNDFFPNENLNNGVVSQQYFEYAWKIAGALLGDRFWEENPDYFWSNNLGAVATREYFDDQFVELGGQFHKPVMTWNGVRWEFPDSYDEEGSLNVWGFIETFEDTPVAGHDELNNFMRYVMDIDALVIQDVNGNGIYDEDDYILFSLVDDSLFTKMLAWGKYTDDWTENTPFADEYFSGETIFLYHGGEVMTYFDPATGIFFGESISTTGGTLWYGDLPWMTYGMYDLNALDIGLTEVPEPSTLMLLIGGCAAATAGLIRRKIRG